MKLVMKVVPGIKEPVSLVASKGFAVGAISNKVYTWTTNHVMESS